MTQNLQPRNVRQPEIKKHQVRWRLSHARQRFGSSADDFDLLPPRRQDRLGELLDEGIVVDHQDLVRPVGFPAWHNPGHLGGDHAAHRMDQGFARKRLFQPDRTEIFGFETAGVR